MRIYYYHTRPIQEALEEWKAGRHPGHILYGLPLFGKNGVECVLHRYKDISRRWALSLYTAKEILCCRTPYDILYGTSFRGLEIIILLRALHLYRKPIVLWHHTTVKRSGTRWKEWLSRFFYRGIDRMFFFSRKLIEDSIRSKKTRAERMKLIHWGPDLDFYDKVTQDVRREGNIRSGFISTGKENRDFPTLIDAFSTLPYPLDIYTTKGFGHINYEETIRHHALSPQTKVHFTGGIRPYDFALAVARKSCVVICCLNFPYTVGLTTLVEAMGLGLPVISSRNPNFGIDIDKEGIGITVAYGDIKGWTEAAEYIASHPDEARRMGEKSRRLAEERFNLEIFTKEIAENFREVVQDSGKSRNFVPEPTARKRSGTENITS